MENCDICGMPTDSNSKTVVFTTGGVAPRHNDCFMIHKHKGCGGGIAELKVGGAEGFICLACNIVVDENDIVEAKYVKGVLITDVHQ